MTARAGAPQRAGAWPWDAAPQADGALIAHVCGGTDDIPRIASATWQIERTEAFTQTILDAGAEDGAAALRELHAAAQLQRIDPSWRLVDAFEGAFAHAGCVAVLLYADDDAAVAAALAAARAGISVVRVGASRGDAALPRAISRLADLQLVAGLDDARALRKRVAPERIHVVGDPLVDTVRRLAPRASLRAAWRALGVEPRRYVLVTQPRDGLALPADAVAEPAGAGYVEHLSLVQSARAVVSSSPRVAAEAAALGVPCLADAGELRAAAPPADPAPLWDGRAGARIARVLVANFARVRLA